MADPITAGLVIGSTLLKAGGSIAGGIAKDKDAKREARATYAVGARKAYDAKQAGDIMASNARAAMAGSGGVASDPGMIERLGEIGRDADFNSLAAMYESKTKSRQLRRVGKRAKIKGFVGGFSSLLDGASKLYAQTG